MFLHICACKKIASMRAHTHTHTHTQTRTHACTHARTHARTHTRTHTHAQTHTHTHTHTHTRVCTQLTVPKGLRQNELRAALQLVEGSKIIRLKGRMMDLFGGWDDEKLKASFEVSRYSNAHVYIHMCTYMWSYLCEVVCIRV